MKKLILISTLFLAGCANDPTLVTDVVGTLVQGGITAIQAAQIYSAVSKENNGQQLSVDSVLADISAGSQQAVASNFKDQVGALVAQLNVTITNMQAKGATTSQVKTAVGAQITAGEVQLQAVAPATASIPPVTHFYRFTSGNLVCVK